MARYGEKLSSDDVSSWPEVGGGGPHGHSQSDITGLSAAFAGKCDLNHTHTQSDVVGLTDSLSSKSDIGHTHPGGSGPLSVIKATTQAFAGNTTLQNINGMSFSLTSGITYHYEFYALFASSATTTGLRLGLTYPNVNFGAATISIPVAANGTAAELQGQIVATGTSVTGTGVAVANTYYQASVWGCINPSSSGLLTLQFCSEVAGSAVAVRAGSMGMLHTMA